MNTLSWFLYLASISSGFSQFLLVIAIGLATILVIYNAVAALYNSVEEKPQKVYGVKFMYVAALAGFLSILVPNKDTLYMIAASEVGEMVITSPENQEVFGKVRTLINTKLDEAIAGE